MSKKDSNHKRISDLELEVAFLGKQLSLLIGSLAYTLGFKLEGTEERFQWVRIPIEEMNNDHHEERDTNETTANRGPGEETSPESRDLP